MIDGMEEELQLFLEDMDDQLQAMENTLLDISEISISDVDKEMINTLFRAMHTMKGNAGVFGFTQLIEFSHKAENLLDEIRNDNIPLKEEHIDLFLEIKDHAKSLVNSTTQDELLSEEEQDEHKRLLEVLSFYLSGEEQPTTKEPKVEEEPLEELVEDKEDTPKTYKVEVTLKEDFFKSGMDILSILKYLKALGEIESFDIQDHNLPSFEQLNPQNAYLGLSFIYTTIEPEEEIVDAFEFVQEDVSISIETIENQEEVQTEEKVVQEQPQEFAIFKKVNKKTDKKLEPESKSEPQEESSQDSKQEFAVFKKASKKEQNTPTKKKQSNLNIEPTTSLRVDSSKVDKLINQISEMVIANAKITQYALNTTDNDLEEAVHVMSTMLEEVRDGIMDIRMVQIGDSLTKLRRVVNDTAKNVQKEINFEIIGGETELDKTVIEKISDPLIHMIRNSIDHGIETPEVRLEHDKNPQGSITLKAYPDAGTIVIKIIDDGSGIDKETILNKAIEKNLVDPLEQLSDKEIFDLIFMPGFSTAKKVTEISGRGVGMDVVRKNIESLRGQVEIDSTLGQGTTFTIRLPLTLAIIDGFLVQVGDEKYIIPLDNIQECIELTKPLKEQLLSQGFITLRSKVLPILNLCEHFNIPPSNNKRENIVIVKYGVNQVGLKVDQLFGEFQTVIKPLGKLFDNISGISGGTILGDGEIALIFDIGKLIKNKISNKEAINGN
jgi:two-component system, chemotaxis family, sensor kinase CheA